MTHAPEAIARIVEVAEPGDLFLMANKTYHWGRVMPGGFTDAGTFLSTEAEPHVQRLRDKSEIVPDDIAAQAIRRERLRVVECIRGGDDGRRSGVLGAAHGRPTGLRAATAPAGNLSRAQIDRLHVLRM